MLLLSSCSCSAEQNVVVQSQSRVWLCDSIDCSTQGFPPSLCPLSCWCHPIISSSVTPFSPCLNLSHHQSLFQWVGSSHQVAKASASTSATVLPMNIQGWLPLGLSGLFSFQSKRLSGVFSSTTVWNHQFFSVQTSLRFNSHMTIGKNLNFDCTYLCQ